MAAARRGEVVVITGASAGVGRATAEAFARRGARIGLIARGRARLEAARATSSRWAARRWCCRPTSPTPRRSRRRRPGVERELGPIDVWVNNAMASVLWRADAREVRRVTEVHYLGCCPRHARGLRRMLARDRGTIVQVGSALAYRSIPLQAVLRGEARRQRLHRVPRCELLHDRSGIKVTEVQMPPEHAAVLVGQERLLRKAQPAPPIYQPEVAAEAIYWAAHHDRRELLVGWSTVQAVWGTSCSGLIDRTWPAPGTRASSMTAPRTVPPNTSGSQSQATRALTATSTIGRATAASSLGDDPSLVAGAGGAGTLAVTWAARAARRPRKRRWRFG